MVIQIKEADAWVKDGADSYCGKDLGGKHVRVKMIDLSDSTARVEFEGMAYWIKQSHLREDDQKHEAAIEMKSENKIQNLLDGETLVSPSGRLYKLGEKGNLTTSIDGDNFKNSVIAFNELVSLSLEVKTRNQIDIEEAVRRIEDGEPVYTEDRSSVGTHSYVNRLYGPLFDSK